MKRWSRRSIRISTDDKVNVSTVHSVVLQCKWRRGITWHRRGWLVSWLTKVNINKKIALVSPMVPFTVSANLALRRYGQRQQKTCPTLFLCSRAEHPSTHLVGSHKYVIFSNSWKFLSEGVMYEGSGWLSSIARIVYGYIKNLCMRTD